MALDILCHCGYTLHYEQYTRNTRARQRDPAASCSHLPAGKGGGGVAHGEQHDRVHDRGISAQPRNGGGYVPEVSRQENHLHTGSNGQGKDSPMPGTASYKQPPSMPCAYPTMDIHSSNIGSNRSTFPVRPGAHPAPAPITVGFPLAVVGAGHFAHLVTGECALTAGLVSPSFASGRA